jgi:protein tyrosine phosphatase
MLKALVWDIDRLPHRLKLLRGMLTADYNSSVAIYVHCTAGCDRTGEIMGAYMLQYDHPQALPSLHTLHLPGDTFDAVCNSNATPGTCP